MSTQKSGLRQAIYAPFKALGLIVALLAVAAWFNWGTLDPCAALKKDAARLMKESFGTDSTGVKLIAIAASLRIINAGVDTLRPSQCIESLWKINARGENPLDNLPD